MSLPIPLYGGAPLQSPVYSRVDELNKLDPGAVVAFWDNVGLIWYAGTVESVTPNREIVIDCPNGGGVLTFRLTDVLSLPVGIMGARPAIGPSPPEQAVAAGLSTLVFSDEFDGPLDVGFYTTGHKWSSATWYDPTPDPSSFTIANSVLTITADSQHWRELCTQWQNQQGGTFFSEAYYVEARMMCTDWSSIWLYPAGAPYTPYVSTDPTTWNGEIDIIETDQSTAGFQNKMTSTVHVNTGGSETGWGGMSYFTLPANGTPFGEWHVYGMLIEPSINLISFYCDNVLMGTMPAGVSNYRPMTLLLQAAPGNVNEGIGGATAVQPPITKVDWVRVWQASMPSGWKMVQAVTWKTYTGGVMAVPLDVSTTTGNTLIVISTRPGGPVTGITISSGLANFQKLVSVAGAGGSSNEIWYAPNIVGGPSPVVTVTLPHGGDIVIYEVSGGGNPVPDGSNTATGTGTTASVSLTTPTAGDLVIKSMELDATSNWSNQGEGWVEAVTQNTNIVGYQVQPSAGSITGTAVQASSSTWSAAIAALKKA